MTKHDRPGRGLSEAVELAVLQAEKDWAEEALLLASSRMNEAREYKRRADAEYISADKRLVRITSELAAIGP